MTDRWWEPRRPHEPTATFLGRVLDELDLTEMARKAREGRYDDYFCPTEFADGLEIIHLVNDLRAASEQRAGMNRAKRLRIRTVIEAVKRGEFDGTKEESDRWAASKDGQDAMRELLGGRG